MADGRLSAMNSMHGKTGSPAVAEQRRRQQGRWQRYEDAAPPCQLQILAIANPGWHLCPLTSNSSLPRTLHVGALPRHAPHPVPVACPAQTWQIPSRTISDGLAPRLVQSGVSYRPAKVLTHLTVAGRYDLDLRAAATPTLRA